ncbi:serine/threonine protein kinase [Actinomadura graeca]|uniref:Serine/threonine protein kinase n=1 Tax=Actinomadura graeca TaxID=2750812 RepID=A0ABX8QQS2_9ACTN|nr:serine/threonine-protein kinase [Actinomadura graeca]QXJ20771.1 serine/threonine protein kinase [Actinomadura graeca]
MVGKYRLLGRLGEGGMGKVFFGRSPGGRAVAVKVIKADLATDSTFRRRFTQEIETARKVSGIFTAPVVEADPQGDPPWLVTAYVPGPALDTVIADQGALPEHTLRILGSGLAEAIQSIHLAGVVHRDLKPANIILADDGPRLIDFGIARAAGVTTLTQTGGTVGTPAFMAPEQIRGGPITHKVDVFALGMVLCHAAGVHPFGETRFAQAFLYRVVNELPELHALPPSLRHLIEACLEKEPSRRPEPSDLILGLADLEAGADWLPAPVKTMVTRYEASSSALLREPPESPRRQVIVSNHRGVGAREDSGPITRVQRLHRIRPGSHPLVLVTVGIVLTLLSITLPALLANLLVRLSGSISMGFAGIATIPVGLVITFKVLAKLSAGDLRG